jgi:imidazoleglycerol phosphate synthase glutamine amidotransferase subunit HisH
LTVTDRLAETAPWVALTVAEPLVSALTVPSLPLALLTWATHNVRFLAAIEDGPLSATQFHPEKSGDAGAALLANWVEGL